MNARQTAWLERYLVHWNATKAAIEVGYSPKTAYAQGHRLLKDAECAAAIAKAQRESAEKASLQKEDVERQLEDIIRDQLQPVQGRLGAIKLLSEHRGWFAPKKHVHGGDGSGQPILHDVVVMAKPVAQMSVAELQAARRKLKEGGGG